MHNICYISASPGRFKSQKTIRKVRMRVLQGLRIRIRAKVMRDEGGSGMLISLAR